MVPRSQNSCNPFGPSRWHLCSTSTTLPCNAVRGASVKGIATFSHVMCSKVRRGVPKMGVQWNHCLRTYCNKNFRGWIAGFKPSCQLIEIRTRGYPGILATGSYSPFTGHQYTKHWLLAAISQKQDYAPANFNDARQTSCTATGGFEPLHTVSKADVDSLSQISAGLTEGHLTSEAALGLCWLVLAVLPCLVPGA